MTLPHPMQRNYALCGPLLPKTTAWNPLAVKLAELQRKEAGAWGALGQFLAKFKPSNAGAITKDMWQLERNTRGQVAPEIQTRTDWKGTEYLKQPSDMTPWDHSVKSWAAQSMPTGEMFQYQSNLRGELGAKYDMVRKDLLNRRKSIEPVVGKVDDYPFLTPFDPGYSRVRAFLGRTPLLKNWAVDGNNKVHIKNVNDVYSSVSPLLSANDWAARIMEMAMSSRRTPKGVTNLWNKTGKPMDRINAWRSALQLGWLYDLAQIPFAKNIGAAGIHTYLARPGAGMSALMGLENLARADPGWNLANLTRNKGKTLWGELFDAGNNSYAAMLYRGLNNGRMLDYPLIKASLPGAAFIFNDLYRSRQEARSMQEWQREQQMQDRINQQRIHRIP